MVAAVSDAKDGSVATWGWTDTHCHLHDLTDTLVLLRRASEAKVNRLVCIGTSGPSSVAALALAHEASETACHDGAIPRVWATVGQHPHDASSGISEIAALLDSSDQVTTDARKLPGSVVAIGECGLDYHYDYSPREQQRDAFSAQIALARHYGLALVVHTRDAWDDTFAILQSDDRPDRVVIHCFTGGPDEARRCLDLGAYLSFSGIATFKNAEDIRLAVDLCPLDRLLIETDAPYLAPVPHRGDPNEPAYVALVGEILALRKGVDVNDFADLTSQNATEVFGLSQ
jgi:TatD DNase family protein